MLYFLNLHRKIEYYSTVLNLYFFKIIAIFRFDANICTLVPLFFPSVFKNIFYFNNTINPCFSTQRD